MLGIPVPALGKLHTIGSEPDTSLSHPEPMAEPVPIREESEHSSAEGTMLPPPSPHESFTFQRSETDSRSKPKDVMSRVSRLSYLSFCESVLQSKARHELNDTDRDVFRIQFAYVQEWFMRSSWVEKFHFLVLLVEECTDINFLKTLLQSLRAGNAKDLIYSTNQNVNAFYYDILPEDDNRAMDYRTLVKVQTNTRYWFVHLIDSEKLEVFIGLISLSGGALLREVYLHVSMVVGEKQNGETAINGYKSMEVVAKLSQRLGITVQTAMELSKEVEMRGSTIVPMGIETEMNSTNLAPLEEEAESGSGNKPPKSGSAASKKKGKMEKKKKGKEEKERLEVEKQAAMSVLTKRTYITHFGQHIELEETPGVHLLEESMEKFNKKMAETRETFGLDENLQPIGKAGQAPKQAEKGKKNKKNKKGKDSKKDKNKVQVLDEIQMLPLWANRPIMMHLEDDELAHKKKVSKYWAAMIDEVRREQMIREDLDETIDKYTQLLGPSANRPTSPAASQQGKSKKKDEKGKAKGKKGGAKGKKGKNKGKKRPHLLSVEGEVLELFQPEPPLGEEATREMIGAALLSKASPQMTNVYQGRHCIAKLIQDFLHSRVMACCPWGRLMAISSRNRVVEFYSLLSGCRLTPRLVGHSGVITCMAFHDDGDHIMTGSLDTTVRLWNIWARRAVKIYLGHFGTISSLSLSKDFLVTGGHDKTIKVFHIWSGQCLTTTHEDHTVTAVVLSPDASLVYSGCRSGQLCAFNAATGERVHKVAGHEKGVTCLFLSLPLLASAGKDGFARLWNASPLGPSCLIAMDHGRAVTAVSISHLQVITGCESGRMRVWCALSGQLLKLMRVSPTTRPIRDLHCIEEMDHAKIVVSAETGVKIYEFDPLTAPKNKDGDLSRVVNVKPSHSKFLLDLDKRSQVQFGRKTSFSAWQEFHDPDVQLADNQDTQLNQVKASPSGIKLRTMRDAKMEALERRMCADPKARVRLDNCPVVTNTFFTKIVAEDEGTIFTDAPGEVCEIFPRRRPERTQKYRLPLQVPTWEEYCQKLELNPTKHSMKKPQVKPSHKNLFHLYRKQRLSI